VLPAAPGQAQQRLLELVEIDQAMPAAPAVRSTIESEAVRRATGTDGL